ncbi:MAG: pantetheine-phosphate adenylyltransferase [Ilumatobacter sp.]|uniref:pantetheine-phosphate adenylyltransferase n=1 Tax=Ilumatobacter sp. TaxID=1967498 RepID=UPI002630C8BE|nr:pantetheine-phosphate adenylyltransferase [Ilumatobacter sp.]MDJ0770760.1 pantetheine-phosphate adenylyltransferase [Ilumatobacter sp.]
MATVLIPGSFDPLHLGHIDVVDQAVELFGDVVVGVLVNFDKPSGMFTPDERVELAEASLPGRPTVTVRTFGGLAVQAAADVGADFMVKGLRTPQDFDIEQQMAHTNHSVTGIRTVFVPCRSDAGFISSRFIREIASYGGDVSHLVAPPVAAVLADRFAEPPNS